MSEVSQVEQETNVSENPMDRIVSIIETSAVTLEDQQIARNSKAYITEVQTKWVDRYNKWSKRDPSLTLQEFYDLYAVSFQTNTGISIMKYDRYRPSFRIMITTRELSPDGKTTSTTQPSWDYEQKVLTELGVLKPGQPIEDLKKLPQTMGGFREDGTQSDGPYWSTEGRTAAWGDSYAGGLSTNIPGVEVLVPIGKTPGKIEFSMNLDTFKQVVTSPSKLTGSV